MDSIKSAIYLLIVIALINGGLVGIVHFYKKSSKVEIPSTDKTMTPEYDYGSKMLKPVRGLADLKIGMPVAFMVPNRPDGIRVAWVVALEGQLVSLKDRKWKTDGNDLPMRNIHCILKDEFPDTIIPAGCVWLISNVSEEDSSTLGPLPARCVIGQLPALE